MVEGVSGSKGRRGIVILRVPLMSESECQSVSQ